MIPPKGSIPRKSRGKTREDAGLDELLKGAVGGVGGFLEGVLKGLGKTLESVKNLNLEDLVKLAETQGNEGAKEKINELKGILERIPGEKGIGDLFDEGLDLSKLIDFAVKHGGKGMIQSGLRGHILGIPLGGKDLPLERKRTQETSFEVKGTRPQKAWKAPEKTVMPQDIDICDLEIDPIEEDEKFLKVCGYMAGVEEGNITCEVENGTVLRISAEGQRKYEKKIELSSPVIQEVKWSYRNGVLEITLTKK